MQTNKTKTVTHTASYYSLMSQRRHLPKAALLGQMVLHVHCENSHKFTFR